MLTEDMGQMLPTSLVAPVVMIARKRRLFYRMYAIKDTKHFANEFNNSFPVNVRPLCTLLVWMRTGQQRICTLHPGYVVRTSQSRVQLASLPCTIFVPGTKIHYSLLPGTIFCSGDRFRVKQISPSSKIFKVREKKICQCKILV